MKRLRSFVISFQVVPPCGGHLAVSGVTLKAEKFQVVPPCGGHPRRKVAPFVDGKVSSRAPVWGASFPCNFKEFIYEFQVVPPCGGHLLIIRFPIHAIRVSSRAPVWGASHKCRGRNEEERVSSRAPVWGASEGCEYVKAGRCFKSCPRVGGILSPRIFQHFADVSSRAPVWGASGNVQAQGGRINVSSRAPVWGASTPSGRICAKASSFKSCPRVGGIHVKPSEGSNAGLFQVVPPCGGHRDKRDRDDHQRKVSSRAPVWGASRTFSEMVSTSWVSSRAPVWGASHLPAVPLLDFGVSSRAPVWGASREEAQPVTLSHVSSRAPVWGASRNGIKKLVWSTVSSRAPVWGASIGDRR